MDLPEYPIIIMTGGLRTYQSIFLMILFVSASFGPLSAQEVDSRIQMTDLQEEATEIYKERGVNITPFLVQFIPLGKSGINQGFVAFQSQRIKKGKLLRLGIGADINIEQENTSLNLRLGFGKEISMDAHWTYYRGIDIWFFAGNVNIPVVSVFNDGTAGIGMAPFVGIKYHLTPFLNLATETHFFTGIAFESPLTFRLIPPLSLLLNVRLSKNFLKRDVFKKNNNN